LRQLRLVDRSGQFVGVLTDKEAEELLASGKAYEDSTGRRRKLILKSELVESYDGPVDATDSSQPTTYKEFHAGKKITVLKRVNPATGKMERWDNDLTFEELRRGETVSSARKLRRLIAGRQENLDRGGITHPSAIEKKAA
jgi:hypothetical protein